MLRSPERGLLSLDSIDLLLTFTTTLVLNTETGLLCGIGWAILTALWNVRGALRSPTSHGTSRSHVSLLGACGRDSHQANEVPLALALGTEMGAWS